MPDELACPLRVLDALFAQSGMDRSRQEWGEKQHFARALGLEDEENFGKIPCLNDVALSESIPPFSLVRYRCLVQDSFGMEIYASLFEEHDDAATDSSGPQRLVTTKYRDVLPDPAPGRTLKDLGRDGMSNRGVCYCVPLPGETAWARGSPSQPVVVEASCKSSKRGRDEDADMGGEEAPTRVPPPPGPHQGLQRLGGSSQPAIDGLCIGTGEQVKTSDEFGLNFPLPWEEQRGRGFSMACLVKLYDSDAESLKVCETVEIIGVLCINPELANFDKEEDGCLTDARHPSTALVPRLHALLVRRLPFYHPMFPCTPEWLSEARLAAAFQQRLGAAGLGPARAAAEALLTVALGGDALAAQYVLMLLVSRSFGQHGEQALGCWSMNIASWPQSLSTADFVKSVSELVPRAVGLEFSTAALGSRRWQPSQDFDANRIRSGQLQLASGTLLVLDETSLQEGQLGTDATKAIEAVQTLVLEQSLLCDCGAYSVKLPLELTCLMLSTTRSIIKGANVVLPLATSASGASLPAQAQALDSARFLLGLLTRRPQAIRVPPPTAQQFGEDFARVRQQLQIPIETGHVWMGLARALCLLNGEEELSLDRWQQVAQMERERIARCQSAGIAP